jgi:hypothetical protein
MKMKAVAQYTNIISDINYKAVAMKHSPRDQADENITNRDGQHIMRGRRYAACPLQLILKALGSVY